MTSRDLVIYREIYRFCILSGMTLWWYAGTGSNEIRYTGENPRFLCQKTVLLLKTHSLFFFLQRWLILGLTAVLSVCRSRRHSSLTGFTRLCGMIILRSDSAVLPMQCCHWFPKTLCTWNNDRMYRMISSYDLLMIMWFAAVLLLPTCKRGSFITEILHIIRQNWYEWITDTESRAAEIAGSGGLIRIFLSESQHL